MRHASHPNLVVRLKRAQGHLASVIAMFADGRSCIDLAQQLHAVENALANAKHELIHDHIQHCLDGAPSKPAEMRSMLRELKAITKYL